MNRIQELLELYGVSYTEQNGIYTAIIDYQAIEIHGLMHLTCLIKDL